MLSRQANATVILADVEGVDAAAKTVQAEDRRVPYDLLVIATGARHSYFGHDDWAKFAPGLKRIDDATMLRRRILLAFEKAEIETDARERERLLSFVLVGGGPTGVEMAGAIAELAAQGALGGLSLDRSARDAGDADRVGSAPARRLSSRAVRGGAAFRSRCWASRCVSASR